MKKRAFCPGHRPESFFRSLVFFVFLAASFLVLPSLSFSEDTVTIESTGSSVISPDNAALARDAAIADALRKAVEQASGTFVSSGTLVENFQVIEDSVYANSGGYVKNYSIISEGPSAGLYQVRVRAVVSTDKLIGDLDALGLLQVKAGRPRVLFMVEEKGSAGAGGYWWHGDRRSLELNSSEAALKQAFLAKGFNVVDITGARLEKTHGEPDLSGEAARSLGSAMKAEVVVFGRSYVEEGLSTGATSVVNYLVDMTIQAVRVDDGVVLASKRARGTSRNISPETGRAEAVEAAASVVSAGLIAQITERWAGPQTIRVTLKNMDYKQAAEFKRYLKTRVRGVEAIYQRKHSVDETSIEVEVKASAQSIADDISRHGKYKVTGFTSNAIEVEGAK